MSAPHAALPDTALSAELHAFVDSLSGEDCTVGELIDRIGDRGFGLILLMLAMPAALPIPAAGYATPFGLVMALLGLQLAAGRKQPWLPAILRDRTVPFKMLDFAVRNGRLPLRAVELLIRPRLSRLTHNRMFLTGIGLTIAMLALTMSVPLPLTNTAPSFAIFIAAAGLLEEDGLALLIGMLLAPLAVAIAGLAIYWALTYGPEAVETTLKPLIKSWLGLS